GGTCLHRGCIPSKVYLRSAELLDAVRRGQEFGIVAPEVKLDFALVHARKEKIVANLYKGVQGLLKKHGVAVYAGTGAIEPGTGYGAPVQVRVQTATGEERLTAPRLILATGSRPKTLGLPIDGRNIMTSDEALEQTTLPRSVIIIGAGAIGMEWASLYADFGVEVTVLEFLPRILPTEDEEIAAELEKLMRRRGVRIVTGAAVEPASVRVADGQVTLAARVGPQLQEFTAEAVLVAAGREPVTEGIGLEHRPAVRLGRGGFVEVDGYGRTGDPAIYAIGDVAGGGLAHVAYHQGIIAMEHIKGLNPEPFSMKRVPRCIFTRPEVASVGMTEAEARAAGYSVKVGRFPFRGIGKALVHGSVDGFVKLVADADGGILLGAHLIGPEVTNYVSEAGLALLANLTAEELATTIHPHPTLSEVLGEAALAVEGRAIHA
ncbi:MAG: dihydrolipoyl dehydrogenase, partial [Firmicutes bacterium]|nr:dihydrolipoyl dehydrogenase [Bacillota bacterium]